MVIIKNNCEQGELIKGLREAEGVSRYRLEQVSGVWNTTIMSWENNGKKPVSPSLIKVLDALGYELVIQKKK